MRLAGGGYTLYDIAADPSESHDLAATMPDKVRRDAPLGRAIVPCATVLPSVLSAHGTCP